MKQKKKKFKLDRKLWTFFFICLAFIVLFNSSMMFWRNFHNVDLVFNSIRWTNSNIDNIVDEYEVGKYIPLTDAYIIGMGQIEKSFKLLFLSGLFFAIGIFLLLFEKK